MSVAFIRLHQTAVEILLAVKRQGRTLLMNALPEVFAFDRQVSHEERVVPSGDLVSIIHQEASARTRVFNLKVRVLFHRRVSGDKMDKEDIEVLIKNWDIGGLISHKRAEKGVVNINWILKTTKGRYVLRKVVQSKETRDLRFELDYLTHLAKLGFPYRTPAPIRAKNGEFIVTRKGSRFWIYEHIDGREAETFGRPQLRECAKMMAIYHRAIEGSGLNNKKGSGEPFNRRSVSKELESHRARILKKDSPDRKDRIFLRESSILVPLLRSLDESEYSELPRYPVHRDINPENTLWKNKKLVGLIDFENVGTINDTLVKDISIVLQYSCRDRKHEHKLDVKKARLFLREYRKHHRLSNREIEFIPDVATAGSIEDFAYAYWMLVNDPGRAKLYRLKLYSRTAQWYHKNKAEIIRKLTNREAP